MSRSVVGLDLSLVATGICRAQLGGEHYTTTLKPRPKLADLDRLNWILHEVAEHCMHPQLVVVEGPAFGAKGSSVHQLAGLWWLVRRELWRWGLPVAVIPPASAKKYATGKGNAGKDEMLLATARRFDAFDGDNNAADALWLAAMGADHLGSPLVQMPALNRSALDAVTWPDVTG